MLKTRVTAATGGGTAKLNGLDPATWLHDTLKNLTTCMNSRIGWLLLLRTAPPTRPDAQAIRDRLEADFSASENANILCRLTSLRANDIFASRRLDRMLLLERDREK